MYIKKIVIVHRKDTTNLGDIYSSPKMLIESIMEDLNIKKIIIKSFDIFSIANQRVYKKLNRFNPQIVIIGGGGLLTNRPNWMPLIEKLNKDFKCIVFGAGFMLGKKEIKKIMKEINFNEVYVRDFETDLKHIECPSLLYVKKILDENLTFLDLHNKREKILFCPHKSRKHFKNNLKILNKLYKNHKDNLGIHFLGNLYYPGCLSNLIKNILRSSIVVSSSYHVLLWSALLNKKGYYYSDYGQHKFKTLEKYGVCKLNPDEKLYLGKINNDQQSISSPILTLGKLINDQKYALKKHLIK